MRHLILSAAVLALAAAPSLARRPDPQEQMDKLLAGRVAGKPVPCITQFPANRSQTIGNTIVYDVAGTRYVQRFGGKGCFGLTSDRILVTRTPSNQLCRGDIARVLEQTPVIEVGSCSFDYFEPYTKPK